MSSWHVDACSNALVLGYVRVERRDVDGDQCGVAFDSCDEVTRVPYVPVLFESSVGPKLSDTIGR